MITPNVLERVPEGRIRMQIGSYLGDLRGVVIGLNEDSSLSEEEVLILIDHAVERFDIALPAMPTKLINGWKISTLVRFVYENQRPKSPQ